MEGTLNLAPHSLEAEEGVLGAILINSEHMDTLADALRPDDFYMIHHRWIWEVMLSLHARRQVVDYISVTQALRDNGKLAEMGGPGKLTMLTVREGSSYYADTYAAIVQDKAVRRGMLTAAGEV